MSENMLENADIALGDDAAPMDAQKPVIKYFRLSESLDNSKTGFRGRLEGPPEAMEYIAGRRKAGIEDGVTSNLLIRQPGGFSMLLLWIKPNYPLSRHSHDSDCLYYVVSGSIKIGTMTLRAGDGMLVPNECLYVYQGGPEGAELLEIRHDVDIINAYVPSVSEKRIQTEMELAKANVESWKDMLISPTFAANRVAD